MTKVFNVGDIVEFDVLCNCCNRVDRIISGKIESLSTDGNEVEKASVNTGKKYTGSNKDIIYSVKLESLRPQKAALIETILSKYAEFNTYLESIDLAELSKRYPRHELEVFTKQLYSVKIRSLAYEIGKLTKEMKQEEYPELLGVHHYPELNEIDFLSEEEKVALDGYLVRFRVGNIVSSFYHVTYDENKNKQIMEFLKEHEIVDQEFYALCPRCNEGRISRRINKDDKDRLDAAIQDKMTDRYAVLERYLQYNCDECEENFDVEAVTELHYETKFVIRKERDESLDNV